MNLSGLDLALLAAIVLAFLLGWRLRALRFLYHALSLVVSVILVPVAVPYLLPYLPSAWPALLQKGAAGLAAFILLWAGCWLLGKLLWLVLDRQPLRFMDSLAGGCFFAGLCTAVILFVLLVLRSWSLTRTWAGPWWEHSWLLTRLGGWLNL